TTTTTLPEVPNPVVEDGVINFTPNTGQVGDPVSASICLNEAQGLASGWHIRVNIDGVTKEYQTCNTLGSCALECDLGEILKFSNTNHTVRFRINWETGIATLFEGPLPLEFK
ncbi:MAG TPA: hypothetical protein VI387_10395, partial [Candidatus Brocadiales bacterium]|nr:hypothetical protein [Candidatus Brocadiales bacterium]